MKFEVNIEKNDYRGFFKAIQSYARTGSYDKKNSVKSSLFNILVGMCFGVVLVFGFKEFGQQVHWPSLITGAASVFFVIIYYAKRHTSRLMPRHQGVLLGKHDFIVSESGLIDRATSYESKATWNAFVSLQETEQHFFLLLDTCAGYIIPKSQLSSQKQIDDLREFIQGKIRV